MKAEQLRYAKLCVTCTMNLFTKFKMNNTLIYCLKRVKLIFIFYRITFNESKECMLIYQIICINMVKMNETVGICFLDLKQMNLRLEKCSPNIILDKSFL